MIWLALFAAIAFGMMVLSLLTWIAAWAAGLLIAAGLVWLAWDAWRTYRN